MSTEQLEARMTAIEVKFAEMQNRVDRLPPAEPKGIMSIAGAMQDFPEFPDAIAAGRYFRITGQLPPEGWKAGDPIPDPEV